MTPRTRTVLRTAAAAVLAASSAASRAGGGDDGADPLIYSDLDAALSVWRPADDKADPARLAVRPDGLALADISGDCWQDANDHGAVFLRDTGLDAPYFVEAVMDGLDPADPYAQAGLVAWKDQDNYLRLTVGFVPAGYECLVELEGIAAAGGIQRMYPRSHPMETRLRIEVGAETVAGMVSFTPGLWHPGGVLTVPGEETTREFLAGIGILGVGGRVVSAPRFRDWRAGPLAGYRDDDFDSASERAPWRVLLGTPAWGAADVRIRQEDGKLFIRPMPGADIFFGNSAYPCLEQPAPPGASWQIEVRIAAFDATAPGRWRKGGVVLWQGDNLQLVTAIVADDHFDHMYFETLADPGVAWARHRATAGYQPRQATEAVFRVTRRAPDAYAVEASYGDGTWHSFGEFRLPLREPRLRLFASGDVLMQHRGLDWAVGFDSVRAHIPAPVRETSP